MIWHVFFKELLDHWRDRRSVLASLILPFIGPLMLLAVFELVLDLEKERPLEVPIVGAEHAPRLVRHLVSNGVIVQPAPDDPWLTSKRTYWESTGQVTRRVLVGPPGR